MEIFLSLFQAVGLFTSLYWLIRAAEQLILEVNTRGGVESDMTITRLGEDSFRAITGSGFISNDLGWIRMHHKSGDPPVEIRDVTEEYAVLGLWGPRARDMLQAISTSDLSHAALPYMSAKSIEVRGAPVYAQRVTYVGELGWELYIPYAWPMQVWDAVWAEGQKYNIQPGGYKVLDSLRQEKAYRYYSMDVTKTENPYVAGLGFCVRLDKGEFNGRVNLVQ